MLESLDVIEQTVEKVRQTIAAKECPAIIGMSDGRKITFLIDYDYLRDRESAAAFERRAAQKIRQMDAHLWTLALPEVWMPPQNNQLRSRKVSNQPLRPGEYEVIAFTTFDETGVDFGFARYTRRPNLEPIVDEPRILTNSIRMTAAMPGFTLLRQILSPSG